MSHRRLSIYGGPMNFKISLHYQHVSTGCMKGFTQCPLLHVWTTMPLTIGGNTVLVCLDYFTAMLVNTTVFWNMTSCWLVICNRSFRRAWWLCLHSFLIITKKVAESYFKKQAVNYQFTGCHNQKTVFSITTPVSSHDNSQYRRSCTCCNKTARVKELGKSWC